MAPKLTQVNIAVRDMEAMGGFYGRLELPMVAGRPEWAAHHRTASGDDGPDVELDSVTFTSLWNEERVTAAGRGAWVATTPVASKSPDPADMAGALREVQRQLARLAQGVADLADQAGDDDSTEWGSRNENPVLATMVMPC
jgi:hypothetical protein